MRNPRNDRVSSDSDGGGPERKCILSGEHGARDALVRLAISPPGQDGVCEVHPDVLARAPGRGAWIGVSRAELESALAKGKLKGALARAFKGEPLAVSDDLPARIETALLRAFTDRLGLELKGGNLLMGSERIAEAARGGAVHWLGHAVDAGDDGSRKLDQAWRVGEGREGSGMTGTVLPLDRATLSVALGRDNVVHLALTDRAAADRVAYALGRLRHFQGQAGASPAPGTGAPANAAEQTTNPESIRAD